MSRTLRFLGIGLVAAAVWLYLAGAAGWMKDESSTSLGRSAGLAGLVCLGLAVLGSLLGRAQSAARKGRCARCGAATERGQIYCLDHLLATVGEYRDQASQNPPRKSAPAGRITKT